MQDKKQCYTVNEVAKLLKTTRQTILNWRKQGLISVIKVDKKVLITEEEIERLLRENKF